MNAPFNQTSYQGVGSVPADLLNTYTQNVNTAALLRGFIGISTMYVLLGGVSYIGDGNGGIFYWSPNATGPDDNLNVIVPTGSANGAWVRLGTSMFPGSLPIRTTATATPLTSTDGVLEVNASGGSVIITVPVSLGSAGGSPIKIVEKTDTTANAVLLSTDGTLGNVFDVINAPATANGQINGWRMIYTNGTLPRSFGVG